jgi:hypothetical protein
MKIKSITFENTTIRIVATHKEIDYEFIDEQIDSTEQLEIFGENAAYAFQRILKKNA